MSKVYIYTYICIWRNILVDQCSVVITFHHCIDLLNFNAIFYLTEHFLCEIYFVLFYINFFTDIYFILKFLLIFTFCNLQDWFLELLDHSHTWHASRWQYCRGARSIIYFKTKYICNHTTYQSHCLAISQDLTIRRLIEYCFIKILNMLNSFKGLSKCIYISDHILDFVQQEITKFTMAQPYILLILYWEYHACWCFDDFRSQSLDRHGIDPLKIPSAA